MSRPEILARTTCDICPEPAAVVRPATASRELAFYCREDAKRYLGWGDTFRDITEEDVRKARAES